MITPASALLCLTLNIFHESRGELVEVQEAVAAVTINRTKEYSKSICEVVYSKAAFSWTRHHNLKVKDRVALERARRIASDYLGGKVNKQIGNRLYFNEKRLHKRFKTKHKPILLGKMIFY